MKKHLLISGMLLLFLACKKNENTSKDQKLQNDSIVALNQRAKTGLESAVGGIIFTTTDNLEASKELDVHLLAKVASQLNIKYSDIKLDKTSSISYDNVVFFVIAYKDVIGNEEKDISIDRKYVFAHKVNGKILAEESDASLGHLEDEVVQASKTYIFKNLLKLNATTPGIAFYTELNSGGTQVQFWQRKFTILTFENNTIKKVLYNYTIGRGNTSTIDGNTDQTETLESGLRISDAQTNGFNDLIISKKFLYEETNMTDDLDVKANTKTKNETEILKYNGKNYTFETVDKMRFLSNSIE